MNDVVVDSSVVAKWIIPEPDSDRALSLLATGVAGQRRLIVLDLAYPEAANAVWNRYRQRLISSTTAEAWLQDLVACPTTIESSALLMQAALHIAMRYDRTVYDALFVALAHGRGLAGITADEPLYHAVRADYPSISLIHDWIDTP